MPKIEVLPDAEMRAYTERQLSYIHATKVRHFPIHYGRLPVTRAERAVANVLRKLRRLF